MGIDSVTLGNPGFDHGKMNRASANVEQASRKEGVRKDV
jgi:hypothetical protein